MCVALGCVSQELPSAILYSQKQFALCEDEREDHPLCTTHSCRFSLFVFKTASVHNAIGAFSGCILTTWTYTANSCSRMCMTPVFQRVHLYGHLKMSKVCGLSLV